MNLHGLLFIIFLFLTQYSFGFAQDVLRFSMGGSLKSASIELSEQKLSPSDLPATDIYEGNPLVGTFSTNTLTSLKTIESMSLGLENNRAVVLGAGLESTFSTSGLGSFEKEKGAAFALNLFSLVGEIGLRKNLSTTQTVEILSEFGYGLSGKIHISYVAADKNGSKYQAVNEERFTGFKQVALFGRYMFQVWEPLWVGGEIGGFYGSFIMPSRLSKSILSGATLSLKAFLTIN